MTYYLVCLITVPTKKQARRIARELVRLRLAACVNILGLVESHFSWQSKIEKAKEHLLLAKTLKGKFAALKNKVTQMHSYSVPEIIALPIVQGNASYLRWIRESLKGSP